MICLVLSTTGAPEYVVHCSIMWPAAAQVQSPILSFAIIGHFATFFSQSSDAGGGGSASSIRYFANCRVRGSCRAACLPSFMAA